MLVLHEHGGVRFGLIPLETVPDGYAPVGIDGDVAYFESADGGRCRIGLAWHDGMRADVDEVRFDLGACHASVPVLSPDPDGPYVVRLAVAGGGGLWWLVLTVEPYTG